jgi:hypothetical protein
MSAQSMRQRMASCGERSTRRNSISPRTLFRRENRSIDIVTFDELFERARFITRSQ